jgi:ATP-dependent helicase HrpB
VTKKGPVPFSKKGPVPFSELLARLVETLGREHAAVLVAPPGAGKSTQAPLVLLEADWLGGQQILMLEPRRLAARAIAMRMAWLLGEPVGGRIGYRTRLDTQVSRATRLTVLTEGVLTRMLQSDPALEGVGLVIFDEFHERSLNADLGLALCLDARTNLREDLRLLVMSATLDAAPVAALLGGAPVLTGEGRVHPVETRYLSRPDSRSLASATVRAVCHALDTDPGDILVFLPGAAEIRRVERQLTERPLPPGVTVHALFGDLPAGEQDAALAPAPPGRRKVVLATSIAETSLTIEGVRVVVDAGLSRRSRFDPVTGMSGLVTTRVSRAAADQRCGRAGRLAPGICYRLWAGHETRGLEPATPPEILGADLAPLALDLAAWGIADPAQLKFLDPPPAASLAQARELLAGLGALDQDGRVTPHGRRMATLGVHPRLAHMLLAAGELGCAALACDLAAILSERDLLRGPGAATDADVGLRVELLHDGGTVPPGSEIDRGARARAARQARAWRRELALVDDDAGRGRMEGVLLALAYPDRIGTARGDGRYLLSGGRGAFFRETQPLSRQSFIVAAELDSGEREARIFLAAALDRADIERHLADRIETREIIRWDAAEAAVIARRERRLGAILLDEARLDDPDPARVMSAMLHGLDELGLQALPWTDAARSLRQRAEFLRHHLHADDASWPALDDATLAADAARWLAPWLEGVTRRSHLDRLDLHAILAARFSHAARQELERLAPTHLTAPSGSRIPIDYSDPDAPFVAVRLQEVFGLTETPRLAGGRVPLTLQLLSPARRPVQVTRDLESFWARGYAEVRKELKGRYPKHYWPDDPRTATATRRVRPR